MTHNKYKAKDCGCNSCKCEKAKKAKSLLKAKKQDLKSKRIVQKNIMPNGNIHFSK